MHEDRCLLGLPAVLSAQAPAPAGWPAYGGTVAGTRYSPARQITAANVSRLRVAWTYHTGIWQELAKSLTAAQLAGARAKAAFEATPILHNATLYLTTRRS